MDPTLTLFVIIMSLASAVLTGLIAACWARSYSNLGELFRFTIWLLVAFLATIVLFLAANQTHLVSIGAGFHLTVIATLVIAGFHHEQSLLRLSETIQDKKGPNS